MMWKLMENEKKKPEKKKASKSTFVSISIFPGFWSQLGWILASKLEPKKQVPIVFFPVCVPEASRRRPRGMRDGPGGHRGAPGTARGALMLPAVWGGGGPQDGPRGSNFFLAKHDHSSQSSCDTAGVKTVKAVCAQTGVKTVKAACAHFYVKTTGAIYPQ